ncbi:MAG: hypothetical protein K4571_18625 [Deltaproteobacteria bacterium]
MPTTTSVSTLQMTIRENPAAQPARESFRAILRKTAETDWDAVILKADKLISRAGAVTLTLSALYFAFIFVSRSLR